MSSPRSSGLARVARAVCVRSETPSPVGSPRARSRPEAEGPP
jgi:hypothetical protein